MRSARRPCDDGVGVAERRRFPSAPIAENVQSGITIDQVDRQQDRPGHAAAVARAGHRGLHRLDRRLRHGVQLRLHEHDLVEDADDAAADGDQPARRVRADVRPARHERRSAWRACADNRSILDSVREEASRSAEEAGRQDRARLNDYLDNVREIEQRIQKAEKQRRRPSRRCPTRRSAFPSRSTSTPALMYDLAAVAFEANLTRVFTFMKSRDASQRVYPNIGVNEPHHAMSHHGNNPEKIAGLVKLNTYHVSLFAKFLQKLRSTPDGDGSLLDHSLILYGSGMSESDQHSRIDVPTLLVGGAVRQRRRATVTSRRRRKRRSRTCCCRWPTSSTARSTSSASAPGGSRSRSAGQLMASAQRHCESMQAITMRVRYAWLLAVAVAIGLSAAGSGVSLIDAVKAGNRAAVRALIRQRADVNAAEADGMTALHWAVRADDARHGAAADPRRRQRQAPRTATASRRCRSPPPTATPRIVERAAQGRRRSERRRAGRRNRADDGGPGRQRRRRQRAARARRQRQRDRRRGRARRR